MWWYLREELTLTPENFNLDFPSKSTRRMLLTWHAALRAFGQSNICIACGCIAQECSWRLWMTFSAMSFWMWLLMSQKEIYWIFDALDLSNLQPTPFLSFFIALFTVFDQGVFGFNCFKWHVASLTFWYNILLGIVTNTCWWDTIPSKQQWQGLMYFTSVCHWESSRPSKVCGMSFCISATLSWHCAGKHCVWEYRMCQVMLTKIPISCSELSYQQRVEHSPYPSMICGLNSFLSFLRANSPLLN